VERGVHHVALRHGADAAADGGRHRRLGKPFTAALLWRSSSLRKLCSRNAGRE
jgi:hypothetical protein